MPEEPDLHKQVFDRIEKERHNLTVFVGSVREFFEIHPVLTAGPLPIIHSVKSRLKSPNSIADKLERKRNKGGEVTPENVFEEITDLAGVRVLHLHQRQFQQIHETILERVEQGYWKLHEDPRAYSWDPEAKKYFDSLGLNTEVRPTYYTSVHYLVRQQAGLPLCCEIQVRTLFEEIWGEIDHYVNYPHPTKNIAVREQLRVLSKLVSTGTRLADAIFAVHESSESPGQESPPDGPAKDAEFFDPLEDTSRWSGVDGGEIERAPSPEGSGRTCAKRTMRADPGGATSPLPSSLRRGLVLSGRLYSPPVDSRTGGSNRVSIESNQGDGYGIHISQASSTVHIEMRRGGTGISLGQPVQVPNLPTGHWYRFMLKVENTGEMEAHVLTEEGKVLGTANAADTSFNDFNRVAIRGGFPYFISDMLVRKT